MIIVKDDRSYMSSIDQLAIDKGIADLGIHSLRFHIEISEEEKLENRRMAKVLSREEWNARCEEWMQTKSKVIEKVIDLLNENFSIYQYKNKDISFSKDDWDLFFWCNKGDMSYVTLNPNEKRANEQQVNDINKVLDLIKVLETERNVVVYIQYTTRYNSEKVRELTSKVCLENTNKFLTYNGMNGKIKPIGKNVRGSV
ncbi:MAG: hypothetical protein U9Q88_13180 [Bacillota bacterium]|nr:hypothetical protein [Bacillota bacterium]